MGIPQTIFLPDQLQARIDGGSLRRQWNADRSLQIFNYTERCQYKREWDKYTLACRGLILDSNFNLVALPFPKFFNLGEPSCPSIPKGEPYAAYQKVDGSLGIWYHHEGEWRVATRGSFDNDYTRWAIQFAPMLSVFPKQWTVMTEICMPSDLDQMARAVQHEPGLYLLGARDLYHQHDVDPEELMRYDWPKKAHRNAYDNIETLVADAKAVEGTEGWVVRFASGLRVKIKTGWYMRLFRAISDLTETRIKDLMVQSGNNEWLQDFPEEFKDEAEAIYKAIQGRFTSRREVIIRDFARFNSESTKMNRSYVENRKAFALAVNSHAERNFLFMLYDGKTIDTKLLEDC